MTASERADITARVDAAWQIDRARQQAIAEEITRKVSE